MDNRDLQKEMTLTIIEESNSDTVINLTYKLDDLVKEKYTNGQIVAALLKYLAVMISTSTKDGDNLCRQENLWTACFTAFRYFVDSYNAALKLIQTRKQLPISQQDTEN